MAKEKSWGQLIRDLVKAIIKSFYGRSRGRTWHQHVVPYKGDWAVRREGNKRITSKHSKQSTAIRKAKSIARRRKADVVIHRQDGTIRDRINYD